MTPEIAHWTDLAACAGLDTRWWFPERGESSKEALAVCQTCEARSECLEHALTNNEYVGVWGGTTARQRKRMRLGMPIRRQPRVAHGTTAGYHWHIVHHETPCWACTDAESRYRETMKELRKEDGLS